MEHKIQKEFIDTGFGFPIRLMNVPMVKVRGSWTPKINYHDLAKVVLLALARRDSRLTGSEIQFIRTHFEMTLAEFSKRFCVTHVAVLKWEKAKAHPTAMSWTTEKDIRLFILSRLYATPAELAGLYAELEKLPASKVTSLHLDLTEIAA